MRDFACAANFRLLRPLVNNNCLGSPSTRTFTVGAVISIGKEVVGIEEMGTTTGALEILAGGVRGAAANFEADFGSGSDCLLSSNSPGPLPTCGR